MVTREDSFRGVSRNSSQLCQLLKMSSGRLLNAKYPFSPDPSQNFIPNPQNGINSPRHYHIGMKDSNEIQYEMHENKTLSLHVPDTPHDQPLDFSVKKAASHTNGSSKSNELIDETSCFTPSPSPPENSNHTLHGSSFLSRDEKIVTFLPPLPGSESLPAESRSVMAPITAPLLKVTALSNSQESSVSLATTPVYSNSGNSNQMIVSPAVIGDPVLAGTLPLTNVNNVITPSTGTDMLETTVPLPMISPTIRLSESQKHGSKYVRPFKAYPKDLIKSPLSYYNYQHAFNSSYGGSIDPETIAREGILAKISEQKYQVFREIFKAERKSTEQKRNFNPAKSNKSLGQELSGNHSFSGEHSNSSCSTNGDSPNGTVGSSDEVNRNSAGDCNASSTDKAADAITSDGRNGVSESTQNYVPNTSTDKQTDSASTQSRKRPSHGRSASGDVFKDEAYWERRRKNNEAAKRSRDARRQKEDEITIRATFLEHENRLLRMELAALKSENERLRCQFFGVATTPVALPATQFLGLDAHRAIS